MLRNPSSLERYRFLETQRSPLYSRFIMTCLGVFITGLLWASFSEIDVVVRAPAVIRPFSNISTLKNATPGAVKGKNYVHGQSVQAGDALWRIDTSATEVDWQNSTKQLQRLRVDLVQLDSYMASLSVGENQVPPQYPEAFQKAEAYFSNFQRLKLFCEGKKEKWEQERRLPTSMTVAQKVKEARSEWELAELELVKTEAEEKEKHYADRKSLLTKIESLEQRLAELQRLIRESEVRAPISGVVEDVKKFNVHDFLVAGEEIVRIIPSGRENLKLEIKVDTRDIAEVREGQLVTTLFPGLPPSRYGTITARISSVSADSILVNGQVSCFLVVATLAQSLVSDKKGKTIALKPGMNADSRIVVSRKTILLYLLEKLEFIN